MVFPYHRGDISGPHGEGVPMDIMEEWRAMLSQAVDEGAGQGGGHLEELIRVEERSHCGVQAGKSPEQDHQ